ncbi:MAG: YggT family protein [Thermoanaerobacteraceae bacterium]|nr:YggT family protein [Thermoanaerobacteraceae bacterium]
MIFLRIIISFFPRPINPTITKFIYEFTEPILAPFRNLLERFMPSGPGLYLDFSPLLALLFLDFIRGIIIRILLGILW